jgi:outer membrane protein, heavy metal efflux system
MILAALVGVAPVRTALAQQHKSEAAASSATQDSAAASQASSSAPEVKLDAVLRAALEGSPDLVEAKARSRAAREIAPASSRLPDPELEYQLWAQPLARPASFDEAQMHMVGLRQSFPAPGTLGNRSEAAAERANAAEQSYRLRRLELIARVRRAYAAYYRAEREYQIHVEHARLAQQVLEQTRAAYQVGRGTQQDVLRAGLQLSRLHNDVASIEAERRATRGLLNTLMARPVDAPLGPPAAIDAAGLNARLQKLDPRSIERRPEIVAARSAVRAEQSELSASRSAESWPSFMIGVQYMYMPTMQDSHNYGAMLSMTLPWFNPRYGEERRASEARLAAEQSALSSTQLVAGYELYAALQRSDAASKSFTVIETDLLPQAQKSFEAAQAAYRGGQLDAIALIDALSTLLDIRTERERALASLAGAVADVERAAAAPLSDLSSMEREPK